MLEPSQTTCIAYSVILHPVNVGNHGSLKLPRQFSSNKLAREYDAFGLLVLM